MKRLLFIIFLILLLPVWEAGATPYYVKNGGDNGLSGLDDANAWETIAKVNTEWDAGTFAYGDAILFKKGSTWTITSSLDLSAGTVTGVGSTVNRIKIGTYDAGNAPIIQRASGTGRLIGVFEDYVEIDGLHLKRGLIYGNGMSYSLIEHCSIEGGQRAIYLYEYCDHNTIQYNTCDAKESTYNQGSDDGIQLGHGFNSRWSGDIANAYNIIRYNKVMDFQHGQIMIGPCDNNEIYYNYIYDAPSSGGSGAAFALTGRYNKFYGNWINTPEYSRINGQYNEVYNNLFVGSYGAVNSDYVHCMLTLAPNADYSYDISYNKIYNNIFYGAFEDYHGGSASSAVFFVWGQTGYAGSITANEFTNNIVLDWRLNVGNETDYAIMIDDDSDSISGNVYRNNSIYKTGGAAGDVIKHDGTLYTVTEWNAADPGGDTVDGNITTDPGLADPANDQFWPDDAGDACVDTGNTTYFSTTGIKNGETKTEWTSGTGVGVTFSLQTISRSGENQGPDIGAYEYEQTGAPEPPVGGEEDFSDQAGPVPTWAEVDPGTDITPDSATKISWSSLDIRNTSSYYYCDYGADYFNSNWDFQFEVYASAVTEGYGMIHWQLGDEVGNLKAVLDGDAETDDAVILFIKNDSGQYKAWLELVEDGAWINISDTVNINASTLYFITVNRNHAGGANSTGSYTLTVRTGSHDGALIGNVTSVDCSAGEQNGFQYLYVCNTYNSGVASKTASGYTQNLYLTDRSSTIAFSDIAIITDPDGTPSVTHNPTASWSDATVRYIGLEVNKILVHTANPTPARVKLLTGPATADFTWIYFYKFLSIDIAGTLHHYIVFKYTPVIGDRSTDLSFDAVSDALDCNSATLISDGDDLCDEANDDLSRADIGGTGAIILAFPYPTGSPKEFSSTSTLADAQIAGFYGVPGDYLGVTNANAIGAANMSASDGTDGHPITLDGGGFEDHNSKTYGDYWTTTRIK